MFVDILVLILIGISGLIGLMRGATREILGVSAWIAAIALTLYGTDPLITFAYKTLPAFKTFYDDSSLYASLAIGASIFLISLITLSILSRILANRIKNSPDGGLDRSLGLLFGLFRGLFLICFIYLCLLFFFPQDKLPTLLGEPRSLPYIQRGAVILDGILPSFLKPKNPIKGPVPLAENSFMTLSTLTPSPTSPSSEKPGYKKQERQEMDRLFKTVKP